MRDYEAIHVYLDWNSEKRQKKKSRKEGPLNRLGIIELECALGMIEFFS